MNEVSKKLLAVLLIIYIFILATNIYMSFPEKAISYSSTNATVGFYHNIPPTLIKNVSDSEWYVGYTYTGSDLDDHFNDSYGEVLTYTSTGTLNINVSINDDNEIIYSPATPTWSGSEVVMFTAHDPYGLTADSNNVTLTIIDNVVIRSGSDESNGAGGGRPPNPVDTCTEEWKCTEWSTCRFEAYNSTFGEQTRECIDLNNCNATEFKPSEVQTCTKSLFDAGVGEAIEEVFAPVVKQVSHRPVLLIVFVLVIVLVVEAYIYTSQRRKINPKPKYNNIKYGKR